MHTRHTTTGTLSGQLALKPRTGHPLPKRIVQPGPFDVAPGESGRASADMRSAFLTALVAIYPVFASAAMVLTLFAVRGSVV